jgi:hypothetical protein
VVKKENFKISLNPEEEKRLLILESTPRAARPVLPRQNTKPQLTEEDRDRIQEHAQKVIQRENVHFNLHRASSDSAILKLTVGGELTTSEAAETNIPRTKNQSATTEKSKVIIIKKLIKEQPQPDQKPKLESEMRKSKRSRSSCNKPRRPRSISPPPGANTSLLLTPRRRKSMELPLPKKRKTTGGNSVVLPATASENYNSNNKTPRNILTTKSGPASLTMKNSKDTQTDPIGGPSVPAAGCVKSYPTKQFMIKSRDLSRPKIKHHLCVNSYTGPDYHDPIRNLKIGSGKPQKILLTKNRRELRVITNIRRSYSQQSLTVYNIPGELAAGTLPSNHHSSRTRYIPKTRHSLESSISPLQENPLPNKFLQQTDTNNNNLKSMEKLIVLRKRSKILTTTGENSFMNDELKENYFKNNNNLGHSLISEKRIYSQRGHIEKKICIKNDKRMTWIL